MLLGLNGKPLHLAGSRALCFCCVDNGRFENFQGDSVGGFLSPVYKVMKFSS
jgi:hypothetical protein